MKDGTGATFVFVKRQVNSSEANYVSSQFFMMQTEVPQGLYESIMGKNPVENCKTKLNRADKEPAQPVYCVSFEDAVRFANALSEKAALEKCYSFEDKGPRLIKDLKCDGFRLPTHLEWKSAFEEVEEGRIGGYAWYVENSSDSTHLVASKSPNKYEIFDLSGNVAEWVWKDEGQSPYEAQLLGEKRMAIGGSAGDNYINLQPDSGRLLMRDEIDEGTGFRLIRTHR